jgi:uncharacterized iron-regulated membrane protein
VFVTVGADADFTLIEDAGRGGKLSEVNSARTRLTWNQSARTFTVHAATGAVECLPADREWTITFLSVKDKGARHSMTVRCAAGESVSVQLDGHASLATPDKLRSIFELISRAQYTNNEKQHMWWLITSEGSNFDKLQALRALDAPASLVDAVVEILGAV